MAAHLGLEKLPSFYLRDQHRSDEWHYPLCRATFESAKFPCHRWTSRCAKLLHANPPPQRWVQAPTPLFDGSKVKSSNVGNCLRASPYAAGFARIGDQV